MITKGKVPNFEKKKKKKKKKKKNKKKKKKKKKKKSSMKNWWIKILIEKYITMESKSIMEDSQQYHF